MIRVTRLVRLGDAVLFQLRIDFHRPANSTTPGIFTSEQPRFWISPDMPFGLIAER
jgi:hypothetical protein